MSEKLTAADIEKAFADVPTARTAGGRCNVGQVIATHEFGPALEGKIMDVEHYSGATVSRVLKNLGINLSVENIRKHRRGECRCPKES